MSKVESSLTHPQDCCLYHVVVHWTEEGLDMNATTNAAARRITDTGAELLRAASDLLAMILEHGKEDAR